MISKAFHAITMEQCQTCKACCSDTQTSGARSEIVCAYNCIELIEEGKIPKDQVNRLVIFRVPASELDKYARNLRMIPLTNLLDHMATPDEKGYYEFLAIPPAKIDRCPLLSSTGCTQPDIKSYICGMYPFYVHKLEFRSDYNCPWLDNVEEDVQYREMIGRYIVDYILFSEKHKSDYRTELNRLKKQYNFRILTPSYE